MVAEMQRFAAGHGRGGQGRDEPGGQHRQGEQEQHHAKHVGRC